MSDQLARQSIRHAHGRITELHHTIARLEQRLARRSAFRFRCHLCGDPVRKGSRYCYGHSWAETGDD